MCNSTISPSCLSFCLFMNFKTSAWAMNKSCSPPLALWAFIFINLPSMGLSYAIHRNPVSTPHTHPCLWDPHATPLFSIISNIPLLEIFQNCLRRLYELATWNIPSLLQLQKQPALLHLRKDSKHTYAVPVPTMKGTSIILPLLPHTTINSNTTC